MLDGHLRRVAMFRDDGHPDLVTNVLDLTGDQRDEIVLWNEKHVWTTPETARSTEPGSARSCAIPITTSPSIGRTCRCRPGQEVKVKR